MKLKACIAEFLGTGTLTMAVGISIVLGGPLPTPVVAGLTLGIFVYTIGGISGAHLNPAVTIGLWSVQKIKTKDAVSYVVAQILGAGVAYFFVDYLASGGPELTAGVEMIDGMAEMLGAFFLTFGVSSVVFKKVGPGASGLTIGSSLLLGILVASSNSLGVLNPAVALGLGITSSMYFLGPIVGALLAAQLYQYLQKK